MNIDILYVFTHLLTAKPISPATIVSAIADEGIECVAI